MDWNLLDNILLSYIPHGHCYLWKSSLVSLHAISDALIASAYFSIPCTLGYFVFKRKDFPYPRIFGLFGAFIISCGITHVLEIWTLWYPTYWLSGFAKAFTAAISLFTAIELFSIVPQALALKSPAKLEAANLALKREIAERQQVEIELKQSQHLLDDAFEFALIGNALVNLEGNWIKVNPALCGILGYSEAELLSTNFRNITDPEDLEADQNCIDQLLSGKSSSCQFEKRYIHKQGHIIWVLLSIVLERTSEGQPLKFIAQIDDITSRKQAEQDLNSLIGQLELAVSERTIELEKAYSRLQESQAEYQDLYDNAPDMYVSADAKEATVVLCNQTLINELGYSNQEILGHPILKLYHPDCYSNLETTFQASIETGEVQDAQLVLQRKDGSKLDVSLNSRVVRDQTGNILYCRSSWRDISVRKQLERQLQQVNIELEQRVQHRTEELSNTLETLKAAQASLIESEKMAALGTLVAGVAHEINTPIGTSITVASTLFDESENFIQAVETGQLKRSILNHYLDVVRRCTKLLDSNLSRAGDLIQSFKQVAIDQSHLELRTFNLKNYLQEVITSLQYQAKHAGLLLSVTGDDAITLTNDPGVFAQIITNLVTNSIKHAYSDGECGQLQIQVEQKESHIFLTYSDDGCGIPPEHLGKVYEPFFTTARHQGGTGLGLNIVYNLVAQSLNGTIQIDSQQGRGTKFAITLPHKHS